METKKICLTENELEEICMKFHEERTKNLYYSYRYLRIMFDTLSTREKTTIFTKLSKFIDKKSDTFFMIFLVGTMFLITKIAIENYFLSIK